MGEIIVERTYVHKNGVVEKTRFAARGKKRNGKISKSSMKKLEENDKAAVRKLTRVLNCNFSAGDLLITLDYSEAGMEKIADTITRTRGSEREEAAHQCRLFLRRLKKKFGKFKFCYITSDMDGETGELVRLHHHIVMQKGASLDEIEREWKLGSVSIRRLRMQDDYFPVAKYMLRQVRRVPEAQKYTCCKNMDKPTVTEKIVAGGGDIHVRPQDKVLERKYDDFGNCIYAKYKKQEKKRVKITIRSEERRARREISEVLKNKADEGSAG